MYGCMDGCAGICVCIWEKYHNWEGPSAARSRLDALRWHIVAVRRLMEDEYRRECMGPACLSSFSSSLALRPAASFTIMSLWTGDEI